MTPPPKIEALTPSNPQDPWPHIQEMTHTTPSNPQDPWHHLQNWSLDTQQPSRSMTPPPKNETLTPSSPQDPWPHLQKMRPWHPAALKIHDPTSKKWDLDTQQPSRSMTPPPKNETLTPSSPQDPWPHLQKMRPWHPAALRIHDPTSKIETLTPWRPIRTPPPTHQHTNTPAHQPTNPPPPPPPPGLEPRWARRLSRCTPPKSWPWYVWNWGHSLIMFDQPYL